MSSYNQASLGLKSVSGSSNYKDMEGLEKLYTFENSKVEEIKNFLHLHEHLVPILYEAHEQIKRIFGSKLGEAYLELYQDPEEDWDVLKVMIKTSVDPEPALALLDKFNEEYWLDVVDTFISAMVIPL